MKQEFLLNSVEAWGTLAQDIAKILVPGDIVALYGDLGVGKTTFTQALANAMGTPTHPRSPTYSLLRTYHVGTKSGIKRLLHVDAYRIEATEDLRVLDLDDELAQDDAILVLEWPERIQEWLKKRKNRIYSLSIRLTDEGREVTLEG